MNSNKGNQKHLKLSDRIVIEKGLNDGKSFAEIGRETHKDPTTISKEVRKHSKVKEYTGYGNIPCEANKDIHVKCGLYHVCGDTECTRKCVTCRKYRCSDVCPYYQPQQCAKLSRPPYVCNGCAKRVNCMMNKKIYSSKYADDEYRTTLVSAREGINQTPESIQRMNDILTPLIKEKGQSLAHIYATHAQELSCSQRTLYEYIDAGVFDVRNIDLRRAVKYKKRKKPTSCNSKDKTYRIGHNYADFEEYLRNNAPSSIVEMDCVEGLKKDRKVLLTMTFRRYNLILIFLLESQTQEEVLRVFDWLEDELGTDLFRKIFEVILTDGGSEFAAREILETGKDGHKRTEIYYCDPYSFWQKGCCEKNHEYIRYILPKGKTSFEELTQEKITLITNHINSVKRDSLNRHSPFELSQLLLDSKIHEILHLKAINPDEVNLTPELLK